MLIKKILIIIRYIFYIFFIIEISVLLNKLILKTYFYIFE